MSLAGALETGAALGNAMPLSSHQKMVLAGVAALSLTFAGATIFCGYKAYQLKKNFIDNPVVGIDVGEAKRTRLLYIAGAVVNSFAILTPRFFLDGVFPLEARRQFFKEKIVWLLAPPRNLWVNPENTPLLAEMGANLMQGFWGFIGTLSLAGLSCFLADATKRWRFSLSQALPGSAQAGRLKSQRIGLIVLTSLGICAAGVQGVWTASVGGYGMGQLLTSMHMLAPNEYTPIRMAVAENTMRVVSIIVVVSLTIFSASSFYKECKR